MAEHFLAIQHDSHDATTVYGVFDTFRAARNHLETEAAEEWYAEIEVWDGATQTGYFMRAFGKPSQWNETRYETPEQGKTRLYTMREAGLLIADKLAEQGIWSGADYLRTNLTQSAKE